MCGSAQSAQHFVERAAQPQGVRRDRGDQYGGAREGRERGRTGLVEDGGGRLLRLELRAYDDQLTEGPMAGEDRGAVPAAGRARAAGQLLVEQRTPGPVHGQPTGE